MAEDRATWGAQRADIGPTMANIGLLVILLLPLLLLLLVLRTRPLILLLAPLRPAPGCQAQAFKSSHHQLLEKPFSPT